MNVKYTIKLSFTDNIHRGMGFHSSGVREKTPEAHEDFKQLALNRVMELFRIKESDICIDSYEETLT